MKKLAALVPLSAVLLAVSACQSEDPSDPDATEPAEESASIVIPGTPPDLDPALPAAPVFTLPTVMSENPDFPFQNVLEYEHESWSYDVGVEGLAPENRIFVTSYLLPEGTAFPDYDSQLGFIREYDALVSTDSHESSHNTALINGAEGAYRFAILGEPGNRTYQQNYFLFVDNHVVQLTCQWTDSRDVVHPLCGEVQETFALE